MRAVKSRARKQNVGLTIPVATRQARKIVDEVMPGVGATVESRGSADPVTLERQIVTTITFPASIYGHYVGMYAKLMTLPGYVSGHTTDCSITITRKVA